MAQPTDEERCICVRSRASKELRCELIEGHSGPHYNRSDAQGPFLWTQSARPFGSPRTNTPPATSAV